jgi:nucleoside-diphosphate-sugar epimerase
MILNNMTDLTNGRNNKALITGVNGFLGRALSGHLRQAGVNVIGLDVYKLPAGLLEGIQYYQTNLLNFKELCDTLKRLNLEDATVFHLAGQSYVGKSRTDPLTTISTNVTGTAHLLEACRLISLKRIVFPSTALVYKKPNPIPIKETDAVQAGSVYAATKLACEELLRGYASDFGFTCRIVRLGNVYGPGAAIGSVAQIILRQVKDGGPVSIRTLSSVRDFIYRDDVLSGLIALANHANESGCEILNLSSGIPTSIRELAEAACSAGHIKPEIIETEPQLGNIDDRLVLSIERLKEQTGWQPVWNLDDGLRQTLAELETKSK